MRFLDRLLRRESKNAIERKGAAFAGGVQTIWIGGDQTTGDDFVGVATQHSTSADVYAAIELYGIALGAIPWIVRSKTAGKRRMDWEILDEHPFYDLWDRPNPIYTQAEWMQRFVGYHWLGGEVFVQVAQGGGIPTELWLVRPDHIEIKGDDKGQEIKMFLFQPDKSKDPTPIKPIKKELIGGTFGGEMFYTRFNNPLSTWRGMSPFVPAQLGIKIGKDGRVWDAALLRNSARTSAAWTLADEAPSEDQKKEYERQFMQKHTGADKAGIPVILYGADDDGKSPWQYVEMGMSPKDMDWLEGLKLSTKDVSEVTRIPVPLLADYSDATLSNVDTAYSQFWKLGVLPYADMIRDAFNAYLLPFYGDDVWLDYDVSKIAALQEDQNDIWARVKGSKFLLVDEMREMVGLEPLENGAGQVLILSSGDIPTAPEDLGEFASLDNTANDSDLGNDE